MTILNSLIFIVIALLAIITTAAYSVYAERKIAALIQQRVGPNRVGPFGLLQPLADVIKLLLKEDIIPAAANKAVHFVAPMISVSIALITFAVIPFSKGLILADVNVGILYILAVGSIAVYGVTLSGWSSNSKYALLGGLRSSAQMISYELAMGLAVVSVILTTNMRLDASEGFLMLSGIVEAQRGSMVIGGLHLSTWNLFINPVGFFIFTVCAFAETNRAPFDLVEAEQELVGGFHTEYSSMKFALFFLAEYLHIIVASMIITTLFLGGYLGIGEELIGVSNWGEMAQLFWGLAWFVAKTFFMVFVFIWVRWTIPRFKYNQLMDFGWKKFLPLALLNLMVIAGILAVLRGTGLL
jgi:NADH-quinone oxidoreductase subunit H